jgi:hypothetical protein
LIDDDSISEPEPTILPPLNQPDRPPILKEEQLYYESPPSSLERYLPEKEVPNIEITNQTEIIKSNDNNEEPVIPTVRSKMSMDLLSQINSNRLEYGTPSIATVGLPRPDLSPINLNTKTELLEDKTNIVVDNEGIDNSSDSNSSETKPIQEAIN